MREEETNKKDREGEKESKGGLVPKGWDGSDHPPPRNAAISRNCWLATCLEHAHRHY